MDKRLKKKWVKALRSGEYEQGRGHLCRDGKYCCLGVLCVVAGETRHDYYDPGRGLRISRFGPFASCASTFTLTNEQLDRFRLPRESLPVLMRMNDDRNWSFNAIANYIEKHL